MTVAKTTARRVVELELLEHVRYQTYVSVPEDWTHDDVIQWAERHLQGSESMDELDRDEDDAGYSACEMEDMDPKDADYTAEEDETMEEDDGPSNFGVVG